MAEVEVPAVPGRGPLAARALVGLAIYALLKLRGLVVVPFYARLLTREDLGIVVMAGALCGLLGPLLSLGLPTAFMVKVAGLTDRDRIAGAYGTVARFAALAVLAGTLAFALALGQATGPSASALRPHALVIGLWLAATAMRDLALAPFQLRQETGFVAAWSLATEFGGAFIAILLLVHGFGVGGVLWGATAVLAIGVVLGLARSLRDLGAGTGLDRPFLKAALATGLPMLCVSAAEWSVQTADRFVLAHYHGQAAVGSYGIAHSLASAALLVAATVNLVCFPAALHLWHEESGRLVRFLDESLRLVGVLLGLFVTGTCLLARWAVTLIAGRAYVDAGIVLPLVILGYCGVTVIQLLRFVPMVVERRTAPVAARYVAIAAINLFLAFLLIPRFGMKGAALAGLVAQLAGLALVGEVARRGLPSFRWWRPLLRPLLATALVAPASLRFSVPPGAPVGQTIVAAVVSAVIYLGVAAVVGAVTSVDWRGLRALLTASRERRSLSR
jgi:O-antigen/teichoic acid export membrane protein